MTKLLSAFTDGCNAPPFINASLADDGKVEVMLRSEAKPQEGKNFPVADFATMKMTREKFIAFCTEALDTLAKL